MKILKITILICCALISSYSCESHTIIDFENEEIPSRALPNDISGDILIKYKVGTAIILPSIEHANDSGFSYFLRIDVFSKEKVNLILKNVEIMVGGKNVPYGKSIVNTDNQLSEFNEKYGYFSTQIKGGVLTIANPEKIDNVSVAIAAEVFSLGSKRSSGVISTAFSPNKRSYLE
jgi:hypothetical protein